MKFFVTGTDTGIGKTYVTVGLLKAFQQHQQCAIGIKPVASGCAQVEDRLQNEDALALQQASSILLDYSIVNPIAFAPPIAPHIAAQQVNFHLTAHVIQQAIQPALAQPADVYIFEGAGGWLMPLNQQETWANFVSANSFKVIVVVGMRLGCLNHALLTMHALRSANISIAGWVANCIDPHMLNLEENLITLDNFLDIPRLGVIQFQQAPEAGLDISSLIESALY